MEILTSDRALAFVRERGGHVWIWLDVRRCCSGAVSYLGASCSEPKERRGGLSHSFQTMKMNDITVHAETDALRAAFRTIPLSARAVKITPDFTIGIPSLVLSLGNVISFLKGDVFTKETPTSSSALNLKFSTWAMLPYFPVHQLVNAIAGIFRCSKFLIRVGFKPFFNFQAQQRNINT